jgi:hypothetical protein
MPCSGSCNQHKSSISHFFGTRTRLAIQSGCWITLTNPTARSLDQSSPMAWHFSLLKHRRPCLTGFQPGLMLRVCSVTSREMVNISAGLHTNMSLLRRRKSMSLLWGLSRSQFERSWQGRRRRSAQPWHPQHRMRGAWWGWLKLMALGGSTPLARPWQPRQRPTQCCSVCSPTLAKSWPLR